MNEANSLVSYNSSTDSVTWNTGSNLSCYEPWDWYQKYWYPTYPTYISYPIYQQSNFDSAFKIAKLLLKKKLLVSRKLKDFIALVEEIAKEL